MRISIELEAHFVAHNLTLTTFQFQTPRSRRCTYSDCHFRYLGELQGTRNILCRCFIVFFLPPFCNDGLSLSLSLCNVVCSRNCRNRAFPAFVLLLFNYCARLPALAHHDDLRYDSHVSRSASKVHLLLGGGGRGGGRMGTEGPFSTVASMLIVVVEMFVSRS